MTGRDVAVLVLTFLILVKLALWWLKRRERLYAWLSLLTVASSQAISWILAAHPAFLDRRLFEYEGFVLDPSARYPVAIGGGILDFIITLLVLYSRANTRRMRIATAVARCSVADVSAYEKALRASHIHEPADNTTDELARLSSEATHTETRQRAEALFKKLQETQE